MDNYQDNKEIFIYTEISNMLRELDSKSDMLRKLVVMSPEESLTCGNKKEAWEGIAKESELEGRLSFTTLLKKNLYAGLDFYAKDDGYHCIRSLAKASATIIKTMFVVYDKIHADHFHNKENAK